MGIILDNVIPMLVMIAFLVAIHEYGHFIVARRFGVKVETFAIGFGPRLFGWRDPRTGTDWCVRLFPLGGYVKFPAAETDGRKLDGVALTALKRWQRVAILVAGPLVNLAFVPLAFYGYIMMHGLWMAPPEIAEVVDGSPAAEAGLQAGDRLLALDGDPVEGLGALAQRARMGLGQPIETTWQTGDGVIERILTPQVRSVDIMGRSARIGVVGVAMYAPERLQVGAGEGVGRALTMTVDQGANVFKSLWQVASGQRGVDELMGIVGVGQVSGEVKESGGYGGLLMLCGVISLSLGIVNLLPIPVLDGGQISVLAFESVTGWEVTQRAETWLARIGIGAVASLFVVTLVNDVWAILNVVRGV